MLKNTKLIYLNLLLISATVICFEIISTRISSVIFVSNYAFIILSLAIMGLAAGGIYSYYKIKIDSSKSYKLVFNILILAGSSLILFVICVTELKITNPFIYFFLLSIPYFFFGIIYAQLFKIFADYSFILYASDLAGAALGSVSPIFIIGLLGAPNSILLLAVVIFGLAGTYLIYNSVVNRTIIFYSLVSAALLFLIINGNNNFLGKVPIGKFDEKDFHYVYPNADEISQITDSRWSIYGRSDLVQYSDQDQVKQLFIDGAAGSPMFRFNGNPAKPGKLLLELLISRSNSTPFLFLNKNEKNSMLIIGPGGGKEVLLGLIEKVEKIKGIEINPDFVNLTKKYKDFNGGIYTNFPNVDISIAEGRHYIKRSNEKYDIVVMALPSTKQMQNIDALAENENYLLTVEAIKDYLKILTDEGQLIFTLHNEWELLRIITTAAAAFEEIGVDNYNFIDHIAVIEGDYTPTIVIKKNPFTYDQYLQWQNIIKRLPKDIPSVAFLPYGYYGNSNSVASSLLQALKERRVNLKQVIDNHVNNISPCKDDNPYFYKVNRGIPNDYLNLLIGVAIFSLFIIAIPLFSIKKKNKNERNNHIENITVPLAVFICLGLGFMIIEISLFQKLILYLGTPTISLSILLSSLLVGMGIGSYYGQKIYADDHRKRLFMMSLLVVIAGLIFFMVCPLILNIFLMYGLIYRAMLSIIMIIPFGFLLGTLFPTSLKLLKKENMENLIPWMYGVNGVMSVLGSVLAAILSMLYGFTITFFVGLFFYLIIFLITRNYQKSEIKIVNNKMAVN